MQPVTPENSLIVIPTYNEAENIDALVTAIWQELPGIHILVVDDNSGDGTGELVKKRQAREAGRLHLIEREGKLGLGTAYIAGFRWALARSYQSMIEMDADFSHSPTVLPAMIRELGQSNVVIGSRYTPGGGTVNWSRIREAISRFGSFYARTILGMSIRDLTGGFNGWQRAAVERLGLDAVRSEGYSFQIELKYRAFKQGLTLKEIPITFNERRAGQSKMSTRIVIEAMYRVWNLRFSV